jgi:exopolysaccharide biosynthesis protein
MDQFEYYTSRFKCNVIYGNDKLLILYFITFEIIFHKCSVAPHLKKKPESWKQNKRMFLLQNKTIKSTTLNCKPAKYPQTIMKY